jgi:site-specific DNA recombinase
MRVALYARVSTVRQAQGQTIEQQLTLLQTYLAEQRWTLDPRYLFRDEGYSGAQLGRPALDRLRDAVAHAELDCVLITAPDRLARNYVHQVLLVEEFQRTGCQVVFVERPMSSDPHDQLLLQIRGAVAEYERSLITERMRRGRLQKLRAGRLLPWTRPPYGYQEDPARPRDPAGLHPDPVTGVVVQQIFAWYAHEPLSLSDVARRLTAAGIVTPTGKTRWNAASVRWIVQNEVYTGTTYGNCHRTIPSHQRGPALRPVGLGVSHARHPREEWIAVPVPALVSAELIGLVAAKLAQNAGYAKRNNTRHEYLLRALVSCGHCRLCAVGSYQGGYPYYVCTGRRADSDKHCQARYAPATALDELVWQDLCALVTDPEHLAQALARARGGEWVPADVRERQRGLQRARAALEHQDERLLAAYLAGVLDLAEFERARQEVRQRQASVAEQERQVTASLAQQQELRVVEQGMEAFCAQIRAGLANATFAQRRALVELLIDRVIVTDGAVEIRYVIPTAPAGAYYRFSQLRLNYLQGSPDGDVRGRGSAADHACGDHARRDGRWGRNPGDSCRVSAQRSPARRAYCRHRLPGC